MLTLDRTRFFAHVRATLFDGRLKDGQVEGLGAILDYWLARPVADAPQAADRAALAYVLATAFHETAATMQPVRETLANSDAAAIARLDRAFAAGRLASVGTPYWRRDADGKSWLGRGLVQLTHRRNYETLSVLTGVDLVADPAKAMQMQTAVAILVEGMRAGSFTGRRLGDYFAAGRSDWTGARRIINGTDRAERIGGYARAFAAALG